MAEADAERERHQRDGEQRDRVRERRADQSHGGADEAEHERRLVAQPLHDRPDEPALDNRAEDAERREEIAGLRHIEPEAPRHEQREGRLENREREPIDEVDDEHAPEAGTLQHLREVTERHVRFQPPRDARSRAARTTPSASPTSVSPAAAQIGAV